MNDPVLTAAGNLLAEIAGDLDEPTPLALKALVLVDYMDDEGTRWLRIIRSEGMKVWEMRGMLAEVLSDLDAYAVVDVMEETE